ncbi:hypothetical protein ACFL29_00170 [Patescibacteria group bacterium]
MIARIIVGIIGTILGLSMLVKTKWYLRMLGRNWWAERHLGAEGGSRILYKLIGLVIIFITWMYAFNWFDDLLQSLIGGLFGR